MCATHLEKRLRAEQRRRRIGAANPLPSTEAERDYFLARIARRSAGCWEWTGGHFRSGYGCATYRGRSVRAHRLAWRLFRGEISSDQHVMHSCDNPICVNYRDHLVLGTHEENMRDMARKGRANWLPAQASRLANQRRAQ